jgi:hypothetical protein
MNHELSRIESMNSRYVRFEVAGPEQATTTFEGFLSFGPNVSLECAGNLKSSSNCQPGSSTHTQTQTYEGRIVVPRPQQFRAIA